MRYPCSVVNIQESGQCGRLIIEGVSPVNAMAFKPERSILPDGEVIIAPPWKAQGPRVSSITDDERGVEIAISSLILAT